MGKTGAPRFSVNTPTGYARGLTDAGILGDKTFYLSTGEWKFDLSAGKVVRCSRARSKRRQIQRRVKSDCFQLVWSKGNLIDHIYKLFFFHFSALVIM